MPNNKFLQISLFDIYEDVTNPLSKRNLDLYHYLKSALIFLS